MNLIGNGKAIVLTSASPLDENTLEDPTMVAPKTEMVKFSGNTLARLFPGNSLTVLRLATKK
jgi:alpha-L-arabinofuranosidase